MPQIDVRVAGTADAERELRSLLHWLKADEETGRALHGELRSSGPADPEHMGTLLDLITLVVSGGLSAAQLTLCIDQWRTARRTPPRVILRSGTVEVEVIGAEEGTVRAIAALLNGERDDDGGPA
ncbi:effector-associated constant component EACC1 [Streptomyces canus]|uniref:effector-associated constant component EACC1 n=1 Tax=Streptomyces canus TaxID=58343 RepID=UPI00037663BC|nr:hypothetical protein [Streptomyces canus]